jgi:uncharacterized membrane protein YcaP (DUF421 family)
MENFLFSLDPKYEPITPFITNEKESFNLPVTVIKEGKILYNNLEETNKDESWIISNLKTSYQTDVKNVILATVDSKNNLKVFYINKLFTT